jgi:hypothetical protein
MTRARLLALGLVVACRGAGEPASAARRPGAAATARALDTAAVLDTLQRVIREQKLTTLAPDCYSFEPDSGAPPYRFTVREVHNAACGGAPETAPRLFFIAFDPRTGDVETDAFKAPEGATDTIRRRRRP